MGMQAKAWSSAELKKKTIKDVNEAIESGEIEVSGGGTEVIANPTLAGTEAALTGLQVDDTKYKVPESYWAKVTGQTSWSILIADYADIYNPIAIHCTASGGSRIGIFNKQNNTFSMAINLTTNGVETLMANGSAGSQGQVLTHNGIRPQWSNLSSGTKLYQHYLVSGDDRFYIITTNSSPMSYDDVVYRCWEYGGNIISIIYHDDSTNHRHVCITEDNGISEGGSGIKSVAYIHNGAIVVKALPTSGTDTVTEL